MATATHTGPIGIDQINRLFFVGLSGSPNIQQTVDLAVAVAASGGGVVVIPWGYGGTDLISDVTGGANSVMISDQRVPSIQPYYWTGNHYSPAGIQQLSFGQFNGWLSAGGQASTLPDSSVCMAFNPTDAGGAGSGNITAVSGGTIFPDMRLIVAIEGTSELASVMHYHGYPKAQTEFGSDVFVRGVIGAHPDSNAGVQAPNETGYFLTWNLSDGGKELDFINIGLAPEGGFRWYNAAANQQLDRTSPYLMFLNGHDHTLYVENVGLTGNLIFNAPAGHVGLPEFSIIAQPSDGGAAYTAMSFDTTTVPNNALMHFWESIVVRGVIASTANSFLGAGTLAQGGFLITWNLSDGGAETDFINTKSPNAGGFRWYNEDPNQAIDKTTPYLMYLNGANNTLYIDNVNVNGELDVVGSIGVDGGIHLTGQMAIAGQLRVGDISCISIQGDDGQGNPQTLQVLGDGHVAGNWQVAGNVSADSAAFNTCLVANSPVRTFANSPDTGGGMEWPPAGIAVSTGTAWGTSINPATLQGKLTLTTTGTSGAATLAGNALNIPQYTAPAQVYPGAGLAVSTGTAWGAPLDPANLANVAYTNKANTFTTNQTINGTLTSTGAITGGGFLAIPAINIQRTDASPTVPAGTAILRTGVTGAANLVLSAPVGGGIYFNYDQGTGVVNFCNGAGAISASINAAGNASFNGSVTTGGNAVFSGGSINIGTNPVLELRRDSATVSTINAYGGTLQFNTGVGGSPAIVINGTLFANGAKNFRIPHPLDETKELTHSCLEGPEVGVFYRGEVTTTNGIAEVTLPDYFEALTYPEDRSVLLTVIVDDANPVFGAGQIAAGRVKDGKFKVYSSDPSVTIAWEVKAVRRLNVERLQVVTNKPEPEPTATPQDEKVEA